MESQREVLMALASALRTNRTLIRLAIRNVAEDLSTCVYLSNDLLVGFPHELETFNSDLHGSGLWHLISVFLPRDEAQNHNSYLQELELDVPVMTVGILKLLRDSSLRSLTLRVERVEKFDVKTQLVKALRHGKSWLDEVSVTIHMLPAHESVELTERLQAQARTNKSVRAAAGDLRQGQRAPPTINLRNQHAPLAKEHLDRLSDALTDARKISFDFSGCSFISCAATALAKMCLANEDTIANVILQDSKWDIVVDSDMDFDSGMDFLALCRISATFIDTSFQHALRSLLPSSGLSLLSIIKNGKLKECSWLGGDLFSSEIVLEALQKVEVGTLSLAGWGLTDTHVAPIATALERNSILKVVDLGYNRITHVSTPLLMQAVYADPAVPKIILLGGCNTQVPFVGDVRQFLMEVPLAELPSSVKALGQFLTGLNLSEVTRAWQDIHPQLKLSLRSKDMMGEELESLQKLYSHSSSSLSLVPNLLADKAQVHKAIQSNIVNLDKATLDLRLNLLDDVSVADLVAAFPALLANLAPQFADNPKALSHFNRVEGVGGRALQAYFDRPADIAVKTLLAEVVEPSLVQNAIQSALVQLPAREIRQDEFEELLLWIAGEKEDVPRNDEGAPVKVGTIGSGRYYCGRHLGTNVIPAPDGFCGPDDGPQCPSCGRFQAKRAEEGRVLAVTVDRTDGAALGIVFNSSLVIKRIKESGLIRAWNESHTGAQVQAMDEILEVNGAHHFEDMMKEFERDQVLNIKVMQNTVEVNSHPHPLVRLNDGATGWFCDHPGERCTKQVIVDRPIERWTCQECNYDLCHDCAMFWRKGRTGRIFDWRMLDRTRRVVDLSFTGLADADAVRLAKALQSSTNEAVHIILWGNQIGCEGGRGFLEVMKCTRHTIDLRWNPLHKDLIAEAILANPRAYAFMQAELERAELRSMIARAASTSKELAQKTLRALVERPWDTDYLSVLELLEEEVREAALEDLVQHLPKDHDLTEIVSVLEAIKLKQYSWLSWTMDMVFPTTDVLMDVVQGALYALSKQFQFLLILGLGCVINAVGTAAAAYKAKGSARLAALNLFSLGTYGLVTESIESSRTGMKSDLLLTYKQFETIESSFSWGTLVYSLLIAGYLPDYEALTWQTTLLKWFSLCLSLTCIPKSAFDASKREAARGKALQKVNQNITSGQGSAMLFLLHVFDLASLLICFPFQLSTRPSGVFVLLVAKYLAICCVAMMQFQMTTEDAVVRAASLMITNPAQEDGRCAALSREVLKIRIVSVSIAWAVTAREMYWQPKLAYHLAQPGNACILILAAVSFVGLVCTAWYWGKIGFWDAVSPVPAAEVRGRGAQSAGGDTQDARSLTVTGGADETTAPLLSPV